MLLIKHYSKIINRAVFTVLFLVCFPIFATAQDVLVERQTTLMGSVFNFSIVDKDTLSANHNIDLCIAEITRIENLISEWQPYTQISKVNQQAGITPVKVDQEVFDLTKRALEYSKISDGVFDISIAAMDKIWKFDGSMTKMPTEDNIANSVKKVNYKNIILDSLNSSIFLTEKGMKIGFGSIGKGYAADKGRELMLKNGVRSGLVDASGDIATWGTPPNSKTWNIGLRNPFKTYKIEKILRLKTAAVATSGSYEKYAEINGTRFSHIINPKTGYPAKGLISVTIYGPSAEFSNALSTSIMILGPKIGKSLVKKYPNYHFLFITDDAKIIK